MCAIKEGDEVVIDYACGQPFANRVAFMKEGFGFECGCGVCAEGGKLYLLLVELRDKGANERL